jgi:hypothetical protein
MRVARLGNKSFTVVEYEIENEESGRIESPRRSCDGRLRLTAHSSSVPNHGEMRAKIMAFEGMDSALKHTPP